MNQFVNNQITETDINTRKELWDSLFLFLDLSKTNWKNKVHNSNYGFLPLPDSWASIQKEIIEYLIELHTQIETLINSFNTYFQSNIYPVLKETHGDKTLLFRCDRLLKNKILGETSSLFTDLIIWETEFRQVQKFKEMLKKEWNEPEEGEDEKVIQIKKDFKSLIDVRINYSVCQRFYLKWDKLFRAEGDVAKWDEFREYLKDWEKGKGAESEWKTTLNNFSLKTKEFLQQQNNPTIFFSLAKIKHQNKNGITLVTQNYKGWDLNNPYLALVWFHQKPQQVNPNFYRVYFVKDFALINTRNLYTEIILVEDWVWKNYLRSVLSMGSLESANHPVYHSRNL